MAVSGPIAEFARAELPDDWAALQQSDTFGDSLLTVRLNATMNRLFGQTLSESVQDTLDPLVQEYAGKYLALSLISAAKRFWALKSTSVSATGRNETKMYGDRAKYLDELQKQLMADLVDLWEVVLPLLPDRRIRRTTVVPVVEDLADEFALTPDPYGFEAPFADPTTDTTSAA